jgi:hypothetical protein
LAGLKGRSRLFVGIASISLFNPARVLFLLAAWSVILGAARLTAQTPVSTPAPDLGALSSPVLFAGDATTAYRDPAAVYYHGWFYLYFELIKIEPDGKPYIYTAWSKSTDLAHWTPPKIFTPRDQNLNYGSPGGVVRFGNEWILCLQTYPRPHGERNGNADSRIWIMRSQDLENWGPPELLAVMGPEVSREKMGRMIDPFLLQDKDDPGKWWCFFKQKGTVWLSWSRDLRTWTFTGGKVAGGENPCVIPDGKDYILYYAPPNGIGVKRSSDLKTWTNEGVLKLGQDQWPWSQGRLTAGFVLDLRGDPKIGKALMFFHGSRYRENDPRGGFNNFASIGLAWSNDLKNWTWPGKQP